MLNVDVLKSPICFTFGTNLEYTRVFQITLRSWYFLYEAPEKIWNVRDVCTVGHGTRDDSTTKGGGRVDESIAHLTADLFIEGICKSL